MSQEDAERAWCAILHSEDACMELVYGIHRLMCSTNSTSRPSGVEDESLPQVEEFKYLKVLFPGGRTVECRQIGTASDYQQHGQCTDVLWRTELSTELKLLNCQSNYISYIILRS